MVGRAVLKIIWSSDASSIVTIRPAKTSRMCRLVAATASSSAASSSTRPGWVVLSCQFLDCLSYERDRSLFQFDQGKFLVGRRPLFGGRPDPAGAGHEHGFGDG